MPEQIHIKYKHAEKTAVLFFTRSVKEESKAKILSSDATVNEILASAFIYNTEKQIRRSHIPCITVDSSKQTGDTFSEKLQNAFNAVFDLGFENVIAVGNDCPGLTVKDLTLAKKYLETGCAVLGPANDGGVYLLGFSKQIFELISFDVVRWKTNYVFNDLKELCEQQDICIVTENKHADIDSQHDFDVCLHNLNYSFSFMRNIRSILASFNRLSILYFTCFQSTGILSGTLLRAPPVASVS